MEAFTLDTSGVVQFRDSHGELMTLGWNDLSPFAQGYIEALFATPHPRSATGTPMGEILSAKFSDLAPETLARIIADCAEVAPDGGLNGYPPTNESAVADARGAGAEFWRRRNKLIFKRFPPLAPYLGDGGRVYLREEA
jgi:hypothetical protein